MKVNAFFFAFCAAWLCALSAMAQSPSEEGIIHYTRTTHWLQIRNKLPFLSQEEKDRATLSWGSEPYSEYYLLKFSRDKSLYMDDKQAQEAVKEMGWSNRDVPFGYYKDFSTMRKTEIEQALGKIYIVEDSISPVQWRIENQVKDIAGYICMKASTIDPVSKFPITAWFAQDLPYSYGPERYFGLPGVILELDINQGDVLVTATKVDLKPVAAEVLTPKAKGKKLNQSEFAKLIEEHIKMSIKTQRNPYWSIRY